MMCILPACSQTVWEEEEESDKRVSQEFIFVCVCVFVCFFNSPPGWCMFTCVVLLWLELDTTHPNLWLTYVFNICFVVDVIMYGMYGIVGCCVGYHWKRHISLSVLCFFHTNGLFTHSHTPNWPPSKNDLKIHKWGHTRIHFNFASCRYTCCSRKQSLCLIRRSHIHTHTVLPSWL